MTYAYNRYQFTIQGRRQKVKDDPELAPYVARAVVMKNPMGEVLWKDWDSAQSPDASGKTLREASDKARKYAEEWIDGKFSK
ncbi:MAG: hypothetical protein WDZ40_00205 [Candidatus Spechtbacterales bacterium]